MNFNPRTPVGCDIVGDDVVPDALISIHAPQWGATIPQDYINRYGRISIHAPQWGATRNGVSDAAYRCYFNPRTPVGCDSDLVTLLPEPFQFQSTHPSGVRLTFQKLRFRHLAISIHAPQWGATVPYGCVFGVVVISIHAPQWGATRAALEPWARVANFNPRTPVGCDCPAFVTMRRTLIFQSTHPSGVRPLSTTAVRWLWHFNPRTPVGCDCRY